MQNMRTRLFMKKHGPALVFSLCLVGAAAFTTVYTLDQAESTKEQEEQTTELEKEARIQDANAAKKAMIFRDGTCLGCFSQDNPRTVTVFPHQNNIRPVNNHFLMIRSVQQ